MLETSFDVKRRDFPGEHGEKSKRWIKCVEQKRVVAWEVLGGHECVEGEPKSTMKAESHGGGASGSLSKGTASTEDYPVLLAG
jgi:hypothetical protein